MVDNNDVTDRSNYCESQHQKIMISPIKIIKINMKHTCLHQFTVVQSLLYL